MCIIFCVYYLKICHHSSLKNNERKKKKPWPNIESIILFNVIRPFIIFHSCCIFQDHNQILLKMSLKSASI